MSENDTSNHPEHVQMGLAEALLPIFWAVMAFLAASWLAFRELELGMLAIVPVALFTVMTYIVGSLVQLTNIERGETE